MGASRSRFETSNESMIVRFASDVTAHIEKEDLFGEDHELRLKALYQCMIDEREARKAIHAHQGGESEAYDTFHRTLFHDDLFMNLLSRLVSLYDGKYIDQRGPHCGLLNASSGSSVKSAILCYFVLAIPRLVPSVHGFYFSFAGLTANCVKTSLCETIVGYLGLSPIRLPGFSFADHLVLQLQENQRKLFLVVDEVERAFREERQEMVGFCQRSLIELAALGNNRKGVLAIILSGSSTRLEAYIRHSGLTPEEKKLPVLSKTPDMNRSSQSKSNHLHETVAVFSLLSINHTNFDLSFSSFLTH